MADGRIVGRLGEHIALQHLLKNGYAVLARNWKRKLGELDIVVQKGGAVVFVEVKATAGPRRRWKSDMRNKPEDKLTPHKYRKLSRLGELYLAENNVEPKNGWRIDLIAIDLDPETKTFFLRHLENIER